MKLVERTKFFGDFIQKECGEIGAVTKIVDKNGVILKNGDVVKIQYSEEGFTFFFYSIVFYSENENKFSVMGISKKINVDGSYPKNLTIERVFDSKEFNNKTIFAFDDSMFTVEEE